MNSSRDRKRPDISTEQVTIHIKLSDFLARLTSASQFDMKIPAGASVEDVLHLLTERLGDGFRKAIMDRTGKLHGGIAVVVNKRFIAPNQLNENRIYRQSHLNIIPLAGGG